MEHKHLFHIQNKQHLLCTSGNFHALQFVAVKAKIWWNNNGSSFFWNMVYMNSRVVVENVWGAPQWQSPLTGCIIIINKVLIKVTLNKVIAGAL